jgi:hypothetical protein
MQMMFRLLTIFTLALGFVAEAWADVPPPPPPPGRKYVTVYNKVRLGKLFDDYVFFIAHGQGPGPPRYDYWRIALSTESSASIPVGGRHQYVWLLAVPKASADQIRTDPFDSNGRPEFSRWSDVFEIAGLQLMSFDDTATIAGDHPRGSLTRTYTITGFGQDRSIETTVEREPADPEGKIKSAPEAEQRPTSRADVAPGETGPDGTRSVVAGIAVALSCAVGGFLLVRRQRTRVVPTPD